MNPLGLALAAAIASGEAPRPILLDGSCGEDAWRAAARTEVGEGVALLVMQDPGNLYLCWTLPPDARGVDLYLQAPDGSMHNLHTSARVGERTRGTAGWPEWRWENHIGWFSPPYSFTGARRLDDGTLAYDFALTPAKEMQVSKDRFGRGRWRIYTEVVVRKPDGKLGPVSFPKDADADHPDRWPALEVR